MEERQRWVRARARQRELALVLPLEWALEPQQEQALVLLQELLRLRPAMVYRTNCKKRRYWRFVFHSLGRTWLGTL